MPKITIKDLERMKAAGTIRGFSQPNTQKNHKKGTKTAFESAKEQGQTTLWHIGKPRKIPKSEAKQVSWLRFQLQYWAKEKNQVLLEEHRFSHRKWRFDFAFKEIMIAIEYEGINSAKSGHTTLVGYTKDTEKYNEAAKLGWDVLRFTAVNYKTAPQKLTETWTTRHKNG